MKKTTYKSLVLLVGLALLAGGAKAQGLAALFGYSTFYLPDEGKSYVETYLDFDASTLTFAPTDDGSYRATVEVTLVVRQGDSVAYVKKYDLSSPTIANPEQRNFTFLDLQRFYLGNGIYDLELTLRDKVGATRAPTSVGGNAPTVYNDKLVVYYAQDKPSISSVQLMSKVSPTETENILSRGGYDMLPYVNDFMPAAVSSLRPYFEIYNLDKEVGTGNNEFDVVCRVVKRETGFQVPGFASRRRHKVVGKTIPILQEIDISALPSGNYELVVEVNNTSGETMLTTRVGFQRSNPQVQASGTPVDVATSFAGLITDEEQLNYYLKALYPISNERQKNIVNGLVEKSDLQGKQTFLYEFWTERSGMKAASDWEQYRKWLEYVDAHYSYPLTPGYRTDRGRVYLQYGPPDYIRDEKNFVGALRVGSGTSAQIRISGDAPDSRGHIYYLPYQLWRYNRIEGDDANRVFLFWDEMRSGYYKLLNSNARGEQLDPYWEHRLSQGQLDDEVVGEVGEQFNRGY